MKSFSESYKAAGVDVTAGYKSVELLTVLFPVSAVLAAVLCLIFPVWRSLYLFQVQMV